MESAPNPPKAPDDRTSRPDPRATKPLDELSIALSGAKGVSYDAACRLVGALLADPPIDWTGATSTEVEELGHELQVPGSSLRRALEVAARRTTLARRAREDADRVGARALTRLGPEYPIALLDLELPPPVLWVRGRLPRRPALAIVGPRNADRWALDLARSLAHDLAARGLAIVSGFARGVDVAAHRSALEALNGRTVAVLGCGLGVAYPRQHHELAGPIAEAGALLSESPCGTPPAPWRFPVRNRIIAALGIGTLVVQASTRSGSLITARAALELGREVYAVPGRPGDRRSQGSNLLLRDGAHVALDARSILETLPLEVQDRLADLEACAATPATAVAPDTSSEDPVGSIDRRVLAAIRDGTTEVEQLARRLDLGMDRLLGALLELELDGRIRRLSHREYSV